MEGSAKIHSITVTDATKDGEILKFTIQTKLSEISTSESGKIVLRQYEDLEYLLHNLTTKNDSAGVFIPALPPKPFVAPNQTDAKNKISNSVSQLVKGDEYEQDCKRIQKFLQDLTSHPLFGEDENLKIFLTEEQAPVRAAVKRGLIDSFMTVVDNARFHHFPDTDEEFQRWRDSTNKLLVHIKQLHQIKERLLMTENGHSAAFGNIGKAFRNSNLMDIQQSKLLMRFIGQYSDTLDEAMTSTQKATYIFEDTIGFCLELYTRYLQAAQEMLFRRTCKLVELDSATKALAKAKPKNKDQLQTTKDEAEKAVEEITQRMKTEFEKFNTARLEYFQKSLSDLVERRVEHHQNTCDALSKVIVELKASV